MRPPLPLWRRLDDYLRGQAARLDESPISVDALLDEFLRHEGRIANRRDLNRARRIILDEIGPGGRLREHFSRLRPNDAAMAAAAPFFGQVEPGGSVDVVASLVSTHPWLDPTPEPTRAALVELLGLLRTTTLSQQGWRQAEEPLSLIAETARSLHERLGRAEAAMAGRDVDLAEAMMCIEALMNDQEVRLAERDEQLQRLHRQVEQLLLERDQAMEQLAQRERAARPWWRFWP